MIMIMIITALRQQAPHRGRPGDGAAHQGREGPPDDYNNDNKHKTYTSINNDNTQNGNNMSRNRTNASNRPARCSPSSSSPPRTSPRGPLWSASARR